MQNNHFFEKHFKLVFLCLYALLLLFIWRYWPYISDDSLISFRYVQRFVSGHGLTWSSGSPVEGYSNLLWIICLLVPAWFGLNLVWSAQILGLIFCLATLWQIMCFARRYVDALYAGFSGLLYTSNITVVLWATGGLEQPLLGFLLTLGLCRITDFLANEHHCNASLWQSSWPWGLLCWVRPDMPFLVAVFALFLGFSHSNRDVKSAFILMIK